MKNLLLFIVIFLPVYGIVNADYYSDNFDACSKLDGSSLIADDGTFLGYLSSNEFDSKGIANEFLTYGSEFNSKSIWNEFGTYGSEFNSKSPWNQFTNKGPLIIKGDNYYGRLTLNEFSKGALDTFSVLRCFVPLSDDRYEPYMDLFEGNTYSNTSYNTYSNYLSTDSLVKTCGNNSSKQSDGKCKCNTGYTWEDYNDSSNLNCIKITLENTCIDTVNGYLGTDYKCYCKNGYEWSSSSNKCIKQKTEKEIGTGLCKDLYGNYSYSDGTKGNNGGYNCYCNQGYIWNTNQTSCIKEVKKCGLNSQSTSDGKCTCKTGYIWENYDDANNLNCIKEIIKTPDQLCKESYGNYSISTGKQNSDGTYNCTCKTEYIWNPNQTSCIKEIKIEKNKIETYNLPDNLIEKLDIAFDKIKKSKSNLSNEKKIDYYKKLQLQLENLYLKQKKDQNKNIINYLKDLVKKEIIY